MLGIDQIRTAAGAGSECADRWVSDKLGTGHSLRISNAARQVMGEIDVEGTDALWDEAHAASVDSGHEDETEWMTAFVAGFVARMDDLSR